MFYKAERSRAHWRHLFHVNKNIHRIYIKQLIRDVEPDVAVT